MIDEAMKTRFALIGTAWGLGRTWFVVWFPIAEFWPRRHGSSKESLARLGSSTSLTSP